MDTRNPSRRRKGVVSFKLLVILVPVLFGLMGFAVDLGRLYLIRSELKAAANAMALAGAPKLIGTDQSTADATTAARFTVDNSAGYGNKFNFAGQAIGETVGSLASEVSDPTYYSALADATGEGESSGGETSGSTARYVRTVVTGEAPLIFWSFLSLAQERKVAIQATAVAGKSPPLCTACGIEPIAIAALDTSDTVDFGFTTNTRYTLGFQCTGNPTPSGLTGATQRIPYLLLNRYDEEATLYPEETQQLFRIGAQGLLPSTVTAKSCIQINAEEQIWASATPGNCNQNQTPAAVRAFLCGLATRFDPTTIPTVCESISEIETLTTFYNADTDLTDLDDYVSYIGSTRRVITVAIVETLNSSGTMPVLAFRQFLVNPEQNSSTISPGDTNGRFVVLYIGSVVPLRQGRFDGCTLEAGPGKVVLHR